MARVRFVEIRNFRGIALLDWSPSPGLNCLIGPGDSGKTSVLDAIDLCIGARRSAQFSDADFHNLNTDRPISIAITLGDLPDALRSMEAYGQFLRGYNSSSGALDDEPGQGCETVLTLQLTVSGDLEPVWALVSSRAATQNMTRNLAWADRVRLAPTRIGGSGDLNLSWRRGSVLNRLTDERADASAALVKAARDARAAFGDQTESQLAGTLELVGRIAAELGIPFAGGARALLDAHSVSFSGGTVSLHDQLGVPLDGMGVGSSRLLVAGLQRAAAPQASIVLVDELEHGLEPHRIIRLLGSLGAKEKEPPLQVFATTHSPVAVRELSAPQLHVVRTSPGRHDIIPAGNFGDVQGTIRLYPEAFLASSVIVCEGASEVGLLRGLDLHLTRTTLTPSLTARGVALVDAGGATKLYSRVNAFTALGYRTMAFRDDDVQPTPALEVAFLAAGGKVVAWRSGRALEDELFHSMPDDGVASLVERAIELHGQDVVDAHIRSASNNAFSLVNHQALLTVPGRLALAKASRTKQAGWFKSVSWMEDAAADIVGPNMSAAESGFRGLANDLFAWMG